MLVAFPLFIAGLALMVFGWRMWKICVVSSFGLIGAGLCAALVGPVEYQMLYTLGGGVALGLLSYYPVNHSVSLLGGLIGAGLLAKVLSEMGLRGAALYISAAVALFGFSALAFLNRRHVVIGVTAFLGAVLVVSGLTVFVIKMPGLYGTLHAMGTTNMIVVPFMLMVPTVVSCFYQASEVRRSNAEF